MHFRARAVRGMTLIDVIVGMAITLIIFLAIFGLLRASAQLSTLATETAAATAIANSQMEYVRSLPYSSIGTMGGIPAGPIAQNATTTEDNIAYGVRTFVAYYDDPADGTGASDTTGVTTDYKRVKVSVTFTPNTGPQTVTLVSNFAPPGVESTTGGGTLRLSVVDAGGAPVPGASVTVVNPNTSPAVNLTTFTDATGAVILPGAATSTNYQITVTKAGYSTAKTYDRDTTNQNPSPGHLTVVLDQTTSGTFAIDRLATFTLATFTPIATSTFTDTFSDSSKLGATSNAAVSAGALTLASNGAGGFSSPGSAESVAVAPARLVNWGEASASIAAGGGTASVHITDGSGALIPDAALPGNSAGFSSFPISLYALSTTTYPTLGLKADMSAGAGAPSIADWSLTYAAGPTPLPNVPFTLTGAKTIGSTGAGAAIYKTVVSTSTNASGVATLTLEWDAYQLAVSGYTVSTTSESLPFQVFAGTTAEGDVILTP